MELASVSAQVLLIRQMTHDDFALTIDRMDLQHPLPLSRRRVLGLSLTAMGLLLAAGCAPQQRPAPGSWAEQYYRRKQKYREWGQGTGQK